MNSTLQKNVANQRNDMNGGGNMSNGDWLWRWWRVPGWSGWGRRVRIPVGRQNAIKSIWKDPKQLDDWLLQKLESTVRAERRGCRPSPDPATVATNPASAVPWRLVSDWLPDWLPPSMILPLWKIQVQIIHIQNITWAQWIVWSYQRNGTVWCREECPALIQLRPGSIGCQTVYWEVVFWINNNKILDN